MRAGLNLGCTLILQAESRRFSFDDGIVLLDGASGRIWLLEGELAEASRSLSDDDVIEALTSLQDPLPAPAALPGDAFEPPDRAAFVDLCLGDGDQIIRVRVWDESMAPVLASMLAPLIVQGPPDFTLDLFVKDGRTVLARNGVVAQEGEGVGWWLLIRWLARDLRPSRQWLAVLHAATIVLPGAPAVVIAGVSGSGKTTLSGALIARGGRLVADDATPIESGSRLVWPCPLGMGVKTGSWPIFASLFDNFGHEPVHAFGTRSIRYFEAPRVAPNQGHPIGALLFPTWQAGADLEATRLSPRVALRLLAESGAIPSDEAPYLAEFLAWLEVVPAWRLIYDNLADAVSFVQALADDTPVHTP